MHQDLPPPITTAGNEAFVLIPTTSQEMRLPDCVKTVNGQEWAPIGEAAIDAKDALLGTEMCEELFTPHARNVEYALNGVEVGVVISSFGKIKSIFKGNGWCSMREGFATDIHERKR